jgi:hypothetical protein
MRVMSNVPEPTEADCASLNEEFYDAQPWIYFQQRLAHLMLVASDRDRYRSIFDYGLTAAGVTLKFDFNPSASEVPTLEQRFTAVEAELLLHHSAETLMRFVHAHAEPSPCPWVRLASLTNFLEFKSWVRTTIVEGAYQDVAELCLRVFATDPNSGGDLDSCVGYLQRLARHFLDADSYNAAKHGMAIHGASQRFQVKVDDWELFNRDALSVSWLARWPRNDPTRPRRWTRVSRLLDEATTILLIHTATTLMRSIWVRGRERHLGEPWVEVFRPVPPEQLFDDRGTRHHVLADVYEPLAAGGEAETMIVKSADFVGPSMIDDARPERPADEQSGQ